MSKLLGNILLRVIIIGIVLYMLFEAILFGLASYHKQSEISDLYHKSYAIHRQIENIFQSTITIGDGYYSFMTSNRDATKEDTEAFLDHLLYYEDNYVRNIAMIEGTIIKYNYPYEENQSSIGADLSLVEGQKDDVLLVKNTLKPLFVGPVELVQGGQAFIIIIPILDDNQEYWGHISTVIDADLFVQTIKDEADSNNVNLRISYEGSNSKILLIGDEISGNTVSTTYTNKYISWEIEVADSVVESTLFIDILNRVSAFIIIVVICFFLYKSWILNRLIIHNAKHDYLTGDYNRGKFIDDYKEHLFDGMLIAFTDVNKFKILNDTLGHLFGDWCLQQLSNRFREMEHIRTYRISGDEYILVSTEPMSITRFKEQMPSNSFVFYNEELQQDVDIAISIGILETLDRSISLESILMYLDFAMYDAKKENKGFTIVDKKLMSEYDNIKLVEQQLIEDLKKNKLIPYYQPIINLKTKKIEGFEVLSRWLYKGEIRSAATFIGVVKKIKYVDLVDQNLFDKLQVEYVDLIKECPLIEDMSFSVNLSAETLMIFEKNNCRFDKFITKRVIPIDKTIFEVSEDMNLGVISIETLRYIQQYGYSISVDDFGAGVSKLSDVLSGELRTIKTDKSLLPSKKKQDKKTKGFYTIIKAIRASGSTICVEGVETQEQIEMALDAGCKLAQGYMFSKPIPKEEVIDFVANFDFSKYVSEDKK